MLNQSKFFGCGLARVWRLLFLFWLGFGICNSVSALQSVWLEWTPPADDNVVEYHVFYGTSSRNYTNSVTSYYSSGSVIEGLQEGKRYYFAVSAVDADGNVSRLSEEVSYLVPVIYPAVLQTEMLTDENGLPSVMKITSSWATLSNFQVQYSTDLVNWYPYFGDRGRSVEVYVPFYLGDSYFLRIVNW